MTAKSKHSPRIWGDPDDAPELTEEWAKEAELRQGDKVVRQLIRKY